METLGDGAMRKGPPMGGPKDVDIVEVASILQKGLTWLSPRDPCTTYLRQIGMHPGILEGRGDPNLEKLLGTGERWYVNLFIRGKTAQFLVDSGASHSIVHPELYRSIADPGDLMYKGLTAKNPDGSPLATQGRVILPVHIGDEDYLFAPFLSSIDDVGILGLDFLRLYDGMLEGKTGTLVIREPLMQRIPCQLLRSGAIGSIKQTVTIPPYHLSNAVLSLPRLPEGQTILIEPDQKVLLQHDVVGYHTYVKATQEEGPQNSHSMVEIPVCNFTDSPVTIQEGIPWAVCSVAEITLQNPLPPKECETEAVTPSMPGHLEPLVTGSGLTTKEDRRQLRDLLRERQNAFAAPGTPLGHTDLVQHYIQTGETEPIKVPYRRLPISKKEEAAEEVDSMLRQGIIRPSDSPWSSPIVMVKKKDGSCRFCVDYRELNHVTKKNAYPLPRIDENLDALGGNRWFCTLDLQSGYWQIAMAPEDQEKTAFSTHKGLFEFKVMPFGLCNAPATFQSTMEIVLRGLLGNQCLVYLDDIIIFGSSFHECLKNLEEVLKKLENANLKLKPKKCKLFHTEVEYLGRIVSSDGIQADPEKIRAIQEWPVPTTVREIKAFIGFCSYYREFIPQFSEIAEPLLKVGRSRNKTAPVSLTSEACESFKALKNSFIDTPPAGIPHHFRYVRTGYGC